MDKAGAWRGEYVEADGLRIHVWRTGDGPPVVLSHGAADDGRCWSRVADHLARRFEVIMPDARGHGLSDPGGGDYSPLARAGDLVTVITALGLDRPLVGGHSMGAETSLQVAARHPDLIRGVLLEDPPLLTPGLPLFGGRAGQLLPNPGRWMAFQLEAAARLPRRLALPVARRLKPGIPDEDLLTWAEAKQRVSPDLVDTMRNGPDGYELTPVEMFADVTVPAVLLYGDRDEGAIVTPELAETAARLCPTLRTVHIPGVGHDLHRQRFDEYIAAVDELLAAVYP